MIGKTASNTQQEERNISQMLRNSLMVILTLIFVLLYAAAFSGRLDPLKDNTMLLRLEPIIFVLIGYYFGRFPAQQCEKVLKEEITRQTQKADAAQYAKEKSQLEREAFEEKVQNAKAVLKTITPATNAEESKNAQAKAVKMAVSILNS